MTKSNGPLLSSVASLLSSVASSGLSCELKCERPSYSSNVQLLYVMPSDEYLGKELRKELRKELLEISDLKYEWAFSSYFWECRILLPEISISELEEWEEREEREEWEEREEREEREEMEEMEEREEK